MNYAQKRPATFFSPQTIIRVVIASYFLASSVGLISGANAQALMTVFMPNDLGALSSGILTFALAACIITGVYLRTAVLLLALTLFWSGYISVLADGLAAHIDYFWRDLALVSALMLTNLAHAGSLSLGSVGTGWSEELRVPDPHTTYEEDAPQAVAEDQALVRADKAPAETAPPCADTRKPVVARRKAQVLRKPSDPSRLPPLRLTAASLAVKPTPKPEAEPLEVPLPSFLTAPQPVQAEWKSSRMVSNIDLPDLIDENDLPTRQTTSKSRRDRIDPDAWQKLCT